MVSRPEQAVPAAGGLPPLPGDITLLDGSRFAVDAVGPWIFANTVLRTELLDQVRPSGREPAFSPGFTHTIRLWLTDLLRRLKPGTVRLRLQHLLGADALLHAEAGVQPRAFGAGMITAGLIHRLRKADGGSGAADALIAFYLWGSARESRLPGFDPAVAARLGSPEWNAISSADLPPLPCSIERFDGREWSVPAHGVWETDGRIRCDTTLLDSVRIGKGAARRFRASVFDPRLGHCTRLWLLWEMGRVDLDSVYRLLRSLFSLERFLYDDGESAWAPQSFGVGDISADLFRSFVAHLAGSARNRSAAFDLRRFYDWGCNQSGISDFEQSVLDRMDPSDPRVSAPTLRWEPYTGRDLPPLPARVRLPGGGVYELPSEGVWKPHPQKARLNTTLLDLPGDGRGRLREARVPRESAFSRALAHAMRLFLASRLEEVAVATVLADLNAMGSLERWLHQQGAEPRSVHAESLTFELLDAFRGWANVDGPMKGQTAQKVLAFYTWVANPPRSFPGFSAPTGKLVTGRAFTKPVAGAASRLNDPEESAFCYEEYVQIVDALREEVGGRRRAAHRAVAELCRWLGLRPEAIALSRRGSVWVDEDELGEPHYMYTIPRVKNGVANQGETRDDEIPEELFRLLRSLYPKRETNPDLPLIPVPRGGTPTGANYSLMLKTWARDAGLLTTRVASGPEEAAEVPGGPYRPSALHVTPQRFRRTMATMMSDQGALPEEIAAALDDDTIEMALVYTTNTSKMVDHLSHTLDRHPEWIRILRMFKGQVAAKEDADLPILLGGVPYFSNYRKYADIGRIGGCSRQGDCEEVIPLHCYICPDFRAVDDPVPHERQLEQLRDEVSGARGEESERALVLLRRVDAALVQLTYHLVHRGADASGAPTSKALRRAKIKQSQSITRRSMGT